MSRNFLIQPWKGVGAINFGMSPELVHEYFNWEPTPDDVLINDDEYGRFLQEFYFGRDIELNLAYHLNSKELYHIGFGRRSKNIFFGNIDIFSESPQKVIQSLMIEDPIPYLESGIVVFLQLGVTLSGFHDDHDEQKAITITNDVTYWESIKHELMFFKIDNFF